MLIAFWKKKKNEQLTDYFAMNFVHRFLRELRQKYRASNVLESVHKRPVVPGHVRPRKKEENERNVGGAGVEGGISDEEEEEEEDSPREVLVNVSVVLDLAAPFRHNFRSDQANRVRSFCSMNQFPLRKSIRIFSKLDHLFFANGS